MLVIFDLDGTLFQTALCVINAVNQLTDELKLERIPADTIKDCIGKTTSDFLKVLLPDNINPDDCRERFRTLERCEVSRNGILFTGVKEMLTEIKSNGHTVNICSNGSVEYISLVLSSTGISGYIDDIVSAKTYSSKSGAVKQIVRDIPRAVIVGDTMSDIQAAIDNKIPSIGAAYGYGRKGDLTGSTFLAEDVNDISEYVETCDMMYEVTEKIFQREIKIIGINGVDTSGKTIFTNRYSRFLNSTGKKCMAAHIDDFHNPAEIRCQGLNETEAYYNNAFNYKQLINEVLQPLTADGSIEKDILCLNVDTNKYENILHFSVDKDTVLLVEGVLLFRPPLVDFFDAKIFLHIDFDEVLIRAEKRDVPKYGKAFLQKYIDKYIPIQKRYLDEWTPHLNADIVIDNSICEKPKIITQAR